MAACYLLDALGGGRVGARRNDPLRRNVLGHGHELLPEDVKGFPVPSHGLGAVSDALDERKPSCKKQRPR